MWRRSDRRRHFSFHCSSTGRHGVGAGAGCLALPGAFDHCVDRGRRHPEDRGDIRDGHASGNDVRDDPVARDRQVVDLSLRDAQSGASTRQAQTPPHRSVAVQTRPAPTASRSSEIRSLRDRRSSVSIGVRDSSSGAAASPTSSPPHADSSCRRLACAAVRILCASVDHEDTGRSITRSGSTSDGARMICRHGINPAR
jgi:hypothetical protein